MKSILKIRPPVASFTAFFTLLFSLQTSAAPSQQNINACKRAVTSALEKAVGAERPLSREEAIDLLRSKSAVLPAYLKTVQGGEIPVILVSQNTGAALKPFLQETIGTQIVLQPEWPNDHGLLRVGENIIDVDTPGKRGFGELHKNGLSWKNVPNYLKRRTPDHDVILEVAYSVTPSEKEVADYYQRVRRAAIYRARFTFTDDVIDTSQPNFLKGGGEMCFTFCKGSAISGHLSEIGSYLKEYGIEDIDAFLTRPEIKEYLQSSRKKILQANPNDDQSLNRNLITSVKDLNILKTTLPNGTAKSKMEMEVFANWLVAYDASRDYKSLLQTLQISSDSGINDANHARATAILVYDEKPVATAFRKATYESKGNFSGLTANGQRPIK